MTTLQPTAAPAPTNGPPTRVAPQSGILNRPSEHLILAAFTINGDPTSTLEELALAERVTHPDRPAISLQRASTELSDPGRNLWLQLLAS